MIHTFDVELPHGITLSCRSNGERGQKLDGRLRVLFLHGFPEAAFVWDEVIETLSASSTHGATVAALAPNLRGYERSTAPAEVSAYRAKHLMQDIVALVDAWGGAPVDLLVAHDWGGAVAWGLAAQRPELMRELMIINSPHPATFLRELRHNPAQQEASAYMNFLSRPDAAALLTADDHARLWPFFTNMGGQSWLDEATRARYREVWAMGMEGGLNYYRASPMKPAVDAQSPLHTLELKPADVTSRVPTTVIWAENDIALPPALIDGLEAYVPDLTLHRVPDATHWIVHEQPALIARTIQSRLDVLGAPGAFGA
jgi:pimeloyl-ACP methyl ester carboxylesterase